MFRNYRTLKIKIPRPCCPWCQASNERLEQLLEGLEERTQRLSDRLEELKSTSAQPMDLVTLVQAMALVSRMRDGVLDGPESSSLLEDVAAIQAAIEGMTASTDGPKGSPRHQLFGSHSSPRRKEAKEKKDLMKLLGGNKSH